MRTTTGAIVIFVGLLSIGCGAGGDLAMSSGTVVRDSAGITIIDNGRLDLERDLLASAAASVTIGVTDGDEEYQLFQVMDVKRLSDGAIAVANAGSRELRIYEPDGTHRATAGGAGEGPSEFQYPRALRVLPGDTIEVVDFMDRVYFAPDGAFLRRRTTDLQALSRAWEAAGGQSEGGQWMADGRLFAPVYHWNDASPPQPGPPFRPAMTLVRLSQDFAAMDTLGDYGGILQQYVDVGGSRGVSATVPPFYTNTSWALGSADGTIVIGDNASPEIHRFHPDGSRSIVRWIQDARPITDADVEEWKERQRAADWTQGRLPELERGWAAMEIPETRAYYGRVHAGSDGRLWVPPVDDSADPTALRSFDADGTFGGMVTIPGRFTPMDSGPGWIAGVLWDDADIERVQIYALNR